MKSDVSPKFEKKYGSRRLHNGKITDLHKAIAHGTQNCLEKSLLFLGNEAYKITRVENLCLAGGIALNASANGKLMEDGPFTNIYVQPAASDDGSAMGAALLYYYNSSGEEYSPIKYWSPYLGYRTDKNEIEKTLRISKYPFEIVKTPEKTIASLLAHGFIVGWYQGRAEFGPRALGNRCILSSPFPAIMKDGVNKIKKRAEFRPFAPAVLLEEMPKYFNFWRFSPYMIFTYPVNEFAYDHIPAVIHVDGTSRVQTVEEHQNPRFYELIKRFKEITGTGVILSTSMNGPREPLVNLPSEAVKLFETTEIDALMIDNYLVMKPRCTTVYKDTIHPCDQYERKNT
jgi:carbamoyltransferase